MSLSECHTFECPYCMVVNEIEVDILNDVDQQQVVDCQICCQPIVVTVSEFGDDYAITAMAENE